MPDILKRNKKFFQLLLLVAIVLMLARVGFSERFNNDQIQLVRGKLSVNVKDVALGSVLAVIGEKTGIEFLLDEMEIMPPSEDMVIEPPGKEWMRITPSSKKMVIRPPGKKKR